MPMSCRGIEPIHKARSTRVLVVGTHIMAGGAVHALRFVMMMCYVRGCCVRLRR
jgi:hypothetical protein